MQRMGHGLQGLGGAPAMSWFPRVKVQVILPQGACPTAGSHTLAVKELLPDSKKKKSCSPVKMGFEGLALSLLILESPPPFHQV